MSSAEETRTHIERLDAALRERYGGAAPRLSFDDSLMRGPHMASVSLPTGCDHLALITQVVDGLAPLDRLNLHACFPAAATSDAVRLLTSRSGASDGTRAGLGRTMRDRGGHGQIQYLIDFSDAEVWSKVR